MGDSCVSIRDVGVVREPGKLGPVFELSSLGRRAWKRVLLDPNWGRGETGVLAGSISETVAGATGGLGKEWMEQQGGPMQVQRTRVGEG